MTAALNVALWGTVAYVDAIDALVAVGAYREADDALVAALGDVVGGYDTRGLLAGRLVVRVTIGRCGTRGWLGPVLDLPVLEGSDD